MDPGERGAHGVWLVELRAGARPQPELVPTATVRYEPVTIDVTGADDVAAVRAVLDQTLRARAAAIVREHDGLGVLALRARVTGCTAAHQHVDGELRRASADFVLDEGGTTVCLDRVDAETAPARDLDRLAEGNDAAALVARILRAVTAEPPGADAAEMLARLPQVAAALDASPAYARLGGVPRERLDGSAAGMPDTVPNEHASPLHPLAPALRRALADRAACLLDALLAQREAVA
jgi:hypothetical protein